MGEWGLKTIHIETPEKAIVNFDPQPVVSATFSEVSLERIPFGPILV
jgi:hypothetical protein